MYLDFYLERIDFNARETLSFIIYIFLMCLDFYSERIDFEDSVLFSDKYFVI